MGIGTDELARLRDELIRARARGIRTLEYDGKRVTYTSDAEMAAAIADLDRRITNSTARGASPRTVSFVTSKGV